jgi:anthranilate/para-aminobenzoate synthase component II
LNLASDSSTALTVNQRAVVLTGSRAYDDTTNAAAAILSVANKVGSDDVAVASGTGGLAAAGVGTQGITSLGTLALGGVTAVNYTLSGASGSVVVTQAVTSIMLNSSENPSGFNDSIDFTATVQAFATGMVNFKTNGVLFDAEGLTAGLATSVATTALPRGTNVITVEYAGDVNDLGSTNSINQIVTNHPPVIANIVTNNETLGLTFQISIAGLSNAAAWSDVDGDTLTLSSVGPTSANGVSVTNDSNFIYYTLPVTNDDSFSYTISDGFTNVTGQVYVTAVQGNPTFSGLTPSQSITYGAGSVALSGTVSAPGPLYPANGETITVTINGNAQMTTINDSTGDFTIAYNPSTIPYSASAYPITYSYGGDASLTPVNNSATALTVNQRAVVLTGSRAFDGTTNAAAAILSVANKVGSDDVAVASGTGGLAGAGVGTQPITSLGTLALGGVTAINYTVSGASGSVVITQAVTSITLNSSENPSGFQDSINFTSAVPAFASGTVDFKTNGVLFDTESLTAGSATSVATTALPRGTNVITVEYAGDANDLGSTNSINQVVTNHPPVIANVVTNNETLGLTFQISIAGLSNAAAWSDVDGDTLTLSSVGPTSANGVSVTNDSNFIYYTLPVTNNDSFSYTISDGFTNTTGTVYVNAVSPPTAAVLSVVTTNGVPTISFVGGPGSTNVVQATTNLLNSWVNISTNKADNSGMWQVTDTNATNFPGRFYRSYQVVP